MATYYSAKSQDGAGGWEEFERPHDMKLKDFITPFILSEKEKKHLQTKHLQFVRDFFHSLPKAEREEIERKKEEKRKRREGFWEELLLSEDTTKPNVEEEEEEVDSEDEDKPEWTDLKAMIKGGLMFGSLSTFSLERVENGDLTELMEKIEEHLHNKPGPNPVIVRGQYVNRRPFRKSLIYFQFALLITNCYLLFFVLFQYTMSVT